MRITSKGQVTIPTDIRERASLLPRTDADLDVDSKVVRIVRAKARKAMVAALGWLPTCAGVAMPR